MQNLRFQVLPDMQDALNLGSGERTKETEPGHIVGFTTSESPILENKARPISLKKVSDIVSALTEIVGYLDNELGDPRQAVFIHLPGDPTPAAPLYRLAHALVMAKTSDRETAIAAVGGGVIELIAPELPAWSIDTAQRRVPDVPQDQELRPLPGILDADNPDVDGERGDAE